MKLTELTLENAEAYYKEHRGYVVFEKRDFIIKNFVIRYHVFLSFTV